MTAQASVMKSPGRIFSVAVFGSFTGLQITNGMKSSKTGPSITWIIAAAVSLGGGAIWTMHFIGSMDFFNDGGRVVVEPINLAPVLAH